jgi:hypothetical protein
MRRGMSYYTYRIVAHTRVRSDTATGFLNRGR